MAAEKSKIVIIILFAVAVLSIAGLVTVLILENASTKVPDLTGMTYMEASKYCQEIEITVKDGQMIDGDEDNQGKIMEQYPAAGAEAKAGDIVMVNISRGPGDGRTPDVIKMSTDDAKRAIESAGFEVGSITQIPSAEKAGTVVTQNPKGDKEFEKGKEINLEISDGTMVYVPYLVGKMDFQAKKTLDNYGLKGEVCDLLYSNKVDYGCVLKQSPSSGTAVKRGTKIKLWFSLGREEDEDLYYYDSPPGQIFVN